MKKSLGILLFFFAAIILLRLIGITYGFYKLNIIRNTNNNSLSVEAKFLSVEYEDGTAVMNFEGDYLFPGNSAEKSFTIKNTGTVAVTYNIFIDNVINEFERIQDLRYVLYINDEEITNGAINNNSIQYLLTNKKIDVNEVDIIKFVFEYATTDEIQNVDMNKTISFRFNINSNLVYTNENSNDVILTSNKKINNYRIYGNSIQNGKPTVTDPVEIESVGNLVTDETSEYFGKYDIPVKVHGKNLVNETKYINPSYNANIINNDDHYLVSTSTNTGGIAWLVDGNFQVDDVVSFQAKVNFIENVNLDVKDSVTLRIWNNTQGKWIHPGYNGTSSKFSTITLNTDVLLKFENIKLTSDVYSPGDELLVRVSRGMATGVNKNSITFKVYKGSIMVTKSSLGEYVPYFEPIYEHIYLDEPLRKVGDYADYIDFSKQIVYRKIYKQTLSSQWEWKCYGSAGAHTNNFRYKGIGRYNVISNYGNSGSSIYNFSNDNFNRIAITYDWFGVEDVTSLMTKLAALEADGKPFIVYYPTAIVRETKIKLPNILMNDNLNIISVDTKITPSNVFIEYYD